MSVHCLLLDDILLFYSARSHFILLILLKTSNIFECNGNNSNFIITLQFSGGAWIAGFDLDCQFHL